MKSKVCELTEVIYTCIHTVAKPFKILHYQFLTYQNIIYKEYQMKIAVVKETIENEKRVAASPETVKKFISLGAEVAVVKDAGVTSSMTDAAYKKAGAKVVSEDEAVEDADVVLRVRHPNDEEIAKMKKGAIMMGTLNPYIEKDTVKKYADAGVNAIAMELVPRITRAQTMDILSSQANLAGYRAVIEAANTYGHAFPMFMTAAGTVPPAKTFVMGAGVAGLQAIATAKRLGGQVSATDVRAAAKEQVESLGGKFVMVESEETKEAETAGGYAKEMSDDYKKQQAELIAATISKQDIVITTALIPGRAAPVLVTKAMVATMKAGSVIVDMAVEQGGNVEGSKLNEIVTTKNGVKIIGFENLPSRIADDASALYARNLFAYLSPFIDEETKELKVDWEDEVVKASTLTKDGKVVHADFV